MAGGCPVVVLLAVKGVDPRRVGAVRAGAAGVHVGEHALEVRPVVGDVVDHPPRRSCVADQRIHRGQQRDVDGPDRPDRGDGLGHPGVEHRDEPGPAMAGGVAVAVELDEDDVGLVDTTLRMLVAVVGHLDRDGGVPRILLAFQQFAGQRPARPGVDRRRGGGRTAGGRTRGCTRAGRRWLLARTGRQTGTDEPQQGCAAADPQHGEVLRPPLPASSQAHSKRGRVRRWSDSVHRASGPS